MKPKLKPVDYFIIFFLFKIWRLWSLFAMDQLLEDISQFKAFKLLQLHYGSLKSDQYCFQFLVSFNLFICESFLNPGWCNWCGESVNFMQEVSQNTTNKMTSFLFRARWRLEQGAL